MKITATKEVTFDAAHRLSFHTGKCKNLHGHTYKLQVALEAEQLKNGMVKDFYDIKKILNAIADKYDHSTMLYGADAINMSLAKILKEAGLKVHIFDCEPTSENIARMVLEELSASKDSVNIRTVRLFETPTSYVEVNV